MSSLVVQVTTVTGVKPHPNADTLDIAEVLGWQVISKRGDFSPGQKVVYFPPNTMLPPDVSDRFGVTKYLAKGRIRCAKLRGEPSFGLAVPPDDPAWEVGADVAAHYRATKYEPPLKTTAGDMESPHPYFTCYTDIEDVRNFPGVIEDGEEVVVTEKVDGTNCRVGIIDGEFMAGSKRNRRKQPPDDQARTNLYWHPLTIGGVRDLLVGLSEEHGQAILFGETYGKVQALRYGLGNAIDFVAFDLMVDGKYVDYDEFRERCKRHGIPTAPLLARQEFYLPAIREIGSGESILGRGSHPMEGVVIRPVKERTDARVGRVILKYINDSAFLGREDLDSTDE
jgi:RNA ligase (TIGR02306 family)